LMGRSAKPGPKSGFIDGNDLILGRMASIVAKRLLDGEEITVLNAENCVLSGHSKVDDKRRFLEVRGLASPSLGPRHPKRADTFVRRTIRGMLPWRKPRGRMAFKRLKVYRGLPKEFEGIKLEKPPEASASRLRGPYLRVGDLIKEIGRPT
jgi:large subunit ribosomal protein L13